MALVFNAFSDNEIQRMMSTSYLSKINYGLISFASIDHFIAFNKYINVDKEFAYQFTLGSKNYIGDDIKRIKIMTNQNSKWTKVLHFGRRKNPSLKVQYTPDWNDDKHEELLKIALKLKFDQNIFLRNALIETDGFELMHLTQTGGKWGVCYCRDPKTHNIFMSGDNKLGKLLMEIREEYLDDVYKLFKDELYSVYDI